MGSDIRGEIGYSWKLPSASIYVEVAEDGTVYDDWRLPTRAELDIILNYQGTEDEDADAIDFLLNGNYYYHAGGRTYNSNYNVNGAEPRCVRDAYDDK